MAPLNLPKSNSSNFVNRSTEKEKTFPARSMNDNKNKVRNEKVTLVIFKATGGFFCPYISTIL